MPDITMPSRKLKPDGAYGEHITGYTGDGKARFLADARALLRNVGKHLVQPGLTEIEICVNEAGAAVSGEVTALYWKPDDPTYRVWCEVGTSCAAQGRHDSVIFLARTQRMKPGIKRSKGKGVYRYDESGPNQWLSASFDSHELANRLLGIFTPSTSPQVVQHHSQCAGTLTIPTPFVSNPDEERTWADGMRAWMQADHDDAKASAAAVAPPAPITLSLFHALDHSDR